MIITPGVLTRFQSPGCQGPLKVVYVTLGSQTGVRSRLDTTRRSTMSLKKTSDEKFLFLKRLRLRGSGEITACSFTVLTC